MVRPRILALAGSTRRASWNKQLVRLAADHARKAGAEVTLLDLADYPLPLFDEDLEAEAGLPEPARQLQAMFRRHEGLIIASPEYNSSVTAVLKNTIDWVSRTDGTHPALDCFAGKVAALLSASPGGLGGLRGLVHLRSILGNIGVLVLPDQLAVNQAHQAFDAEGQLVHEHHTRSVARIVSQLVHVVARLTESGGMVRS